MRELSAQLTEGVAAPANCLHISNQLLEYFTKTCYAY